MSVRRTMVLEGARVEMLEAGAGASQEKGSLGSAQG